MKYFYVDPHVEGCICAYKLIRTGEIAFKVTEETIKECEDMGYLVLVNNIHFLDCEWSEVLEIAGSFK